MKVNQVGSNQTEIERAGGVVVLFSYRTPVAVFVPGRGALCSSEYYSRTTGRHVNVAVARWGCERVKVAQAEIDSLAG